MKRRREHAKRQAAEAPERSAEAGDLASLVLRLECAAAEEDKRRKEARESLTGLRHRISALAAEIESGQGRLPLAGSSRK